jgi:hypothetical protein
LWEPSGSSYTTSLDANHFTAEYRTSILRQADACTRKGELGVLLRREGLYSSLLTDWRRRRKAQGRWAGGTGPEAGPQTNAGIGDRTRPPAQGER